MSRRSRTMRAVCLSLLAVLSSSRLSAGQECEPNTPFGVHDLSPLSAYNGGSNSVAGCIERFQCSSNGVLNNMNTASTAAVDLSDPNYLANFVAWDSSITRPYITLQFFQAITFNRVELFFLHYPELNISLPNVELFRIGLLGDTSESDGIPVPYTLANNQDLSSSDMQVRRVTLLFNSGVIQNQVYRLDMSFCGLSNTDWVLLSEIRFCNLAQAVPSGLPTPQTASTAVTATPQDISSGAIELICTIASAGSFQWAWMRGGSSVSGGKFTLTTALSGRMSVLTISDLDPADSGTYTCQVNRAGNAAITASQIIALSVPTLTDPPTTVDTTQGTQASVNTPTESSPTEDTNSSGSCSTSTALAVVLTFLATAGITVLIHAAIYVRFKKTNQRSTGQSTDQPAAPLERQDVVYDEIREVVKVPDVAMEMASNEAYATFN